MSCFCGSEQAPVAGSYGRAKADGTANGGLATGRSDAPGVQGARSTRGVPPVSAGGQQAVIAVELVEIDRRIAGNWDRFLGSEEAKVLLDVRDGRKTLETAVTKYRAACGDEREPSVAPVFDRLKVTDARLANIQQSQETEVGRLEDRLEDLQEQWALTEENDPDYADLVRTELGELSIEIKLYRARWETAMDARLQDRLMAVVRTLDELLEEANKRRLDEAGERGVATASFGPAPSKGKSMTKFLSGKLGLGVDSTGAGTEPSSLELFKHRTSTLAKMAKIVETEAEEQGVEVEEPLNVAQLPESDKTQSLGAQALPTTTSFAGNLYKTMNRRVGDVPDVGSDLRKHAVRGDGRCLFRSVAKGDEYLKHGLAGWSEVKERTRADNLRGKALAELRKHKDLLTTFCVVDGDFERYCRRMQNPRTFGGEPELLMLALLLHKPIAVYLSNRGKYSQIQVYGRQYTTRAINILYSDGIHYDCLLPKSA